MQSTGNLMEHTAVRPMKKDADEMEYTSHYDSPLGGITLASDGAALVGLWFDGQKHFADTLAPLHEEKPLPAFDAAKRWLDVYFGGHAPGFTPSLHMKTTPFRRAVWEIMLSIPFGGTMTYGEIAQILARKTGRRMSAQAVGGAVGHNAISLIVPCHRVIGSNGSLTGYAGGLDRKMRLLAMEGIDMHGIFLPKEAAPGNSGKNLPSMP
jgi:methylated-DNA-[protein]-cysteine S-methyltransferase